MAALIYLDTHVVVWLFAGRIDLFPADSRRMLEASDLLISPIVGLELQYLFEIQRTGQPASTVVETLQREIGLQVCDLPFASVVESAQKQAWTRDPFDRILVGQAALRGAPLLTSDRSIQRHYPHAIWE